ncbi:histidine phosphatase family protein [Microbulbifer elongatus]|uniref:histidine phosphatase family protein n=1 Tax=Microbulbifer elongatus TaxID=86173 RepID=UPI001E613F10|nr:histidine phosphatase family protein [Microbulbifer elongatus]
MHKIVLIRHGEAAKSPTDGDPGLTGLGRQQAMELAQDLQRQYPDGSGVRLISSPKARARQTAMPVSRLWRKPLIERDDFIEIPSPQGIPLAERGNWIQTFLDSDWGNLTSEQALWRTGLMRALSGLGKDSAAKTTLVFCHFLVINAVVAAIRKDERVTQFLADYTSQTRLNLDPDSGALSIEALGRERTDRNQIR